MQADRRTDTTTDTSTSQMDTIYTPGLKKLLSLHELHENFQKYIGGVFLLVVNME